MVSVRVIIIACADEWKDGWYEAGIPLRNAVIENKAFYSNDTESYTLAEIGRERFVIGSAGIVLKWQDISANLEVFAINSSGLEIFVEKALPIASDIYTIWLLLILVIRRSLHY
jgi:hypothetical protein